VIDFAVEHNPERAVFVRNRLMSAGNVDNAEPPHADSDCPVRIKTVVVGPAMGDYAAHFAQSSGVRPRVSSEFKNPSDAAYLAFQRVGQRTFAPPLCQQ